MNKITTGIAGIALAAALAACSPGDGGGDMPEFDSEHRQACYTQQGRFAEYDDDCHDDGNITRAEMLRRRAASASAAARPARTSGGMKTAGPVRPGMPYRPPGNMRGK